MEDIVVNENIYKNILESIKKDDLKMFTSLTLADKFYDLSYGRFPILSICYLYGSNRILSKFEKKLKEVKTYSIIYEDLDVYKKFKKKAGRSIRLYSEDIIDPILMLAVLGEGNKLNREVKDLDDDKLDKVKKTYSLSTSREVKDKKGKPYFKSNPVSKSIKLFVSLTACFVSIMIVLSSLFFVYINGLPNGTRDKPYIVSSSKAFLDSIGDGNYVKLNSNIEILSSIGDVDSNIDGNGKTMYVKNIRDSLFSSFTGSIKDLNIIFDNVTIDVKESICFLITLNSGMIENVNVTIKNSNINIIPSNDNEETVYIGFLSSLNGGVIKSSNVNVESCNVYGYTHVNAYLGGISSKNAGQIIECSTSGNLQTDTVDVAGICSENASNGEVYKCKNYMNITQTTSSISWNPNVSGVVGDNKGTIYGSINYGNLTATSSAVIDDSDTETTLSTLIAGISAQNTGIIQYCINKGNINVESEDTSIMVGGITAYSNGTINMVGSSGKISATYKKDNLLLIGGLCGRLYDTGSCINGYFTGTFEINGDENNLYKGGVVGVCSSMIYQYYYMLGMQYITNDAYYLNGSEMVGVGLIEGLGMVSDNFPKVVGFNSIEEIKTSGVYFDEENIE